MWERLKEEEIDEYLNYLDGNKFGVSWEELKSRTAKELKWERKYREGSEESGTDVRSRSFERQASPESLDQLAPWEVARAEAYSEYAAELAATHPGVRSFRGRILSAAWPLTEQQAYALVESEAAAHLPHRYFEEWSIPLVGHSAEVLEYYTETDGPDTDHRVTLFVDPPGITRRVRYAHERTPLPDEKSVDAQYAETGANGTVTPSSGRLLKYPAKEENWTKSIPVWPGSVLDRLRSLSEKLAKTYRWQELQAVWFVLTGATPIVSPISMKVRTSQGEYSPDVAEITLTVEPWVPAERVEKVYRDLQLQVVSRTRQPWERNLKVYLFVKQKQKEGLNRSELPALWNKQEREDWHYPRSHGFWQAYKNAREAIEDATYNHPDW